MKKEELSVRELKLYGKFKLIAQNVHAKDTTDVDTIIGLLASPTRTFLMYVLIAIGCVFLGIFIVSAINGYINFVPLIIGIPSVWLGIDHLKTFKTTLPKIAKIWISEELENKE